MDNTPTHDRKKELSAVVKSIRTVDGQIKELRNSKATSESDGKLKDAYSLMSSLYATVILQYFDVVAVAYKSWDVHNSLWKACFYNQIEQYRGEMRECNSAIKKLTKEQANDGKGDKLRRKLLRVVTSFSTFLSDSSTFYQDLMLNLEMKLNAKGIDSNSLEMLRHHVYKCLLFLGDIARYTEQNTDSKEKNFSVALRYYERAAFMEPESGNPHNQMAVLAGYGSADCVAVFHYCRSILAKKPFAAGLENLMIFYNKVRKQHEVWLEEEGSSDVANSSADFGKRKSRAESKANKVKVFLMRFTHLHGTLFDVANSRLQRKEDGGGGSGGGGGSETSASEDLMETESSEPGWDVNGALDSAHEVLLELEDLLTAAVFSDSLLLKMLVMCIFSVHINVPPSPEGEQRGMGPERGGGAEGGSSKGAASRPKAAAAKRGAAQAGAGAGAGVGVGVGRGPRFTGESVALIVIYEFVKKVAGRVRALALPQASSSGGGGSGAAKNSSYLNRLIPVLNVFCDWLECNSHYLMASHASLNGHGRSNEALYSNQSLIDTEGRSRVSMRSCLCQLAELLGAQAAGAEAGGNNPGGGGPGNRLWRPPPEAQKGSAGIDTSKPLKEHIELHGFLPLASLYGGYFSRPGSSSDARSNPPHMGSAMPTPVPEENARERRSKAFRSFVKNWVIPCAQREVVEAEGRRLHQHQQQQQQQQQQEEEEEEKERVANEQAQGRGVPAVPVVGLRARQRGPDTMHAVPMLPPSQDSLDEFKFRQHRDVVAMAVSAAADAAGDGDAAEASASKAETEAAASFTYFSPASEQLHSPSAQHGQQEDLLETEEMKESGSGPAADDTESVLGEQVVFQPAFGGLAGLGLSAGAGVGVKGMGGGASTSLESTRQEQQHYYHHHHLQQQQQQEGASGAPPPPGLGIGGGGPPGLQEVGGSAQNLGFLASLADPRLAAALAAGETTALRDEGGGRGSLSEGPSPTDFLGEAPWWNADSRRNDELGYGHQLFGGVDQSAAGLSLLQRISEASSTWVPEIAGGSGGGDGGGSAMDDISDLVLPPPVPLENVSSFGAGPPAAANLSMLQTANPFFRS